MPDSTPAPATPNARCFGPVVATLLLNAAFVFGYVAIYSGDISSLICADREKLGRFPFEHVTLGFPSKGFDGQYYYLIARDPFAKHGEDLELPAYRHGRIVYPFVAWLLTGGDAKLLLWVMPILNILALGGIAWAGAAMARHFGRSTWWGMLLPLVINASPAVLRDLTDPFATLTACAVVAAWVLRWPAWSFLLVSVLAVLSREQNLVIVGIVGLESLIKRRFAISACATAILPIWGAWAMLMHSVYGEWPFVAANTEEPLAGIRHRLQNMNGPLSSYGSRVHMLAMATLLAQMFCTLRMYVGRPGRVPLLISLAGFALAIKAGSAIYGNLESYTRVFWWMPFGVWLWAVQSNRNWPGWLAIFGLLWPAYAMAQAAYKIYTGAVTAL